MSYLSWSRKYYVRELDRAFTDLDAKFQFIHEIDQMISNYKISFEQKIELLGKRLSQLCRAETYAICYINDGQIRVCLENKDSDFENMISSVIPHEFTAGKVTFQTSKLKKFKEYGMLFIPIFEKEEDDVSRFFCALVLISGHVKANYNPLKEEGLLEYAGMVSDQLSILISNALTKRRETFRYHVVRSFLDSTYDYSRSLTETLFHILSFFPNWKPFNTDFRGTI